MGKRPHLFAISVTMAYLTLGWPHAAFGESVAAITGESAGTATTGESRHIARLLTRHPTLATRANLDNLVRGLRSATAITLTEKSGGSSTTFTPPTRPMDYGDIRRTMTFATRQLAAAGATEPTPDQLKTALMGGTVATPRGTIRMPGVLQLRSRGMAWAEIARACAAPAVTTAAAAP